MTTAIKQPTHADLAPKTTEQKARDVAEAAREQEWSSRSFVRELFEGDFDLDLIHPFPEPDPADLARARPFMDRLEKFMREKVDSDKIDREGKIPPEVVEELRQMGAFGLKIAKLLLDRIEPPAQVNWARCFCHSWSELSPAVNRRCIGA